MIRAVLVLVALVATLFIRFDTASAVDTHREGKISHMGPGFGDSYLALPIGRGYTVSICGPAHCKVMTSNDVGPHQGIHPDRIADVGMGTFEYLCGVPASAGLCEGEWTIVGDIELPPTDTISSRPVAEIEAT